MIQLVVVPLVLAAAVQLPILALVIWATRPAAPADRIRTYRPDTVELPAIEPLPEWLHEAGPAVWSAGRTTPNHRLPTIGAFPDPPHPIFARQPPRTLTATVAAAWDHWEASRAPRLTLTPTVVTYHPGAPVTVEQAA